MKLARKHINKLRSYRPGKPIDEVKRELGIENIIKLASNENPIGPSPLALKAILKVLPELNRYPDSYSFYLRQKLAKKYKLSMDNVIVGNGSDELIEMITKAFLEPKDEVVVTKYSFIEYSILSEACGVKINEVAIKDFKYNVKDILNAITPRTKIVFLGNPDNPTGAYLNKKMLDELLKKCPDDILLVIDEAYRELVDVKDYSNSIKYIGKKNVIILRTFSKAYGLAGLRIGYAFSGADIISTLEKVRLPFNVNLLAQKAAEAALDDIEYVRKSAKLVSEGKKFLSKKLKDLGFDTIVSPANFILVRCKEQYGKEIFGELLKYGVIVRDMESYGLRDYFRVNVGTTQENRRFIEALEKVIKGM
ncbi:MAG: histidinol-phosphate transaminase [Candidatus Omnitrophica bacterium]|nr:histidinol-phosphate transaminase [Candidatus Omnitrophota bacterium]